MCSKKNRKLGQTNCYLALDVTNHFDEFPIVKRFRIFAFSRINFLSFYNVIEPFDISGDYFKIITTKRLFL